MNIKSLLRKLECDHDPNLTNKELFLQNDDLKPVEKNRRTWGWLNFVAFWISDAFNVNTWQIASAGVTAGLNWWQVWLTVWIGYTLAGLGIMFSGRIGATYHIPFPVAARSSFGVLGSYWPIVNRVAMTCIWFGVQSWLGGNCVKLMISSIWLNAADNIPNKLGASGTTSYDFLCFFLFILAISPAIWFPVHQIRHLFTVKSYLVPIAGVAFLVWTIVKAGGLGPVIYQDAKIGGGDFAWEFITSVMSCIANFAALIMNDSDFSRFAKQPSSAKWPQFFSIPLSFGITSLIGILVSSASTVIYGETVWSPLDVLDNFLKYSPSAGARAGVFLIATVFALAQAGCNLAANSISCGTDLSAALPRYLNIRRGGYVCALVGFAICPWKLLSDPEQFTKYLGSYTVFLAAIAGVFVADYYLVRKGKYIMEDLYSLDKTSAYMGTYGVSWRAFVGYLGGIIINIVGFAGTIGAPVPIGAIYVFKLNYICGFFASFFTYWIVCLIFPLPKEFCNEHFSEENAEIYFMDQLDAEERASMCDDEQKLGDEKETKLTPVNSNQQAAAH